MSFKDKLKSSQQASGGASFPKLNIAEVLEIKSDGGMGVSLFSYDKESGQNKDFGKKMKGIYIGAAMQLSSYSDSLGPNGGNYKSDYYVSNTNITLFAPTKDGYKKVKSGNLDEIEQYIVSQGAPKPKKRYVLFVLTSKGLYAVLTNVSIAIDQINTHKDALVEKYISLEAKIYSPDVTTISKKAKDFLGKLVKNNPPKYVEISVGDEISEEYFNSCNGEVYIDEYTAWREYKMGKTAEATEQAAQDKPQMTSWPNTAKPQVPVSSQADLEDEDSGLPF